MFFIAWYFAEPSSTQMTFDWPVSCVNIAVLSEISWCWKAFITNIASMWFGVPVDHFVVIKIAGCSKSKIRKVLRIFTFCEILTV